MRPLFSLRMVTHCVGGERESYQRGQLQTPLAALGVVGEQLVDDAHVLHHTQILPQVTFPLLLAEEEELLAQLVAEDQLLRLLLRLEHLHRRR